MDTLAWTRCQSLCAEVLNSLLVRADYQSQPFAMSKLLAYSADGWFSTNPYSKTLALGFLTVYIVFLGTLTIYVVTGDSLYAAFWQVSSKHALHLLSVLIFRDGKERHG